MQPCHTPFPSLNQPIVPCPVLTVDSWPTQRCIRRQVRWSGIPISLRIFQFSVIHKVKVFSVVSEEETYVLLEFSWIFCDATDVGSLVSGSFALSKHSLYIWKFLVYILLRPSLKDFMHNFASMGFPGGSASKEPTCNAGDLGSILGFGRSPGERNSYTLQYSCLKNSMDCIVIGSQTAKYDWDTFTLLAWGMSAIVKQF